MTKTAFFAAILTAAIAIPASAGVNSPSDRNLRKILVGAKTSCEMPIYIAGTRGTLGGKTGMCADGAVETVSFRRSPDIHVKLVSEEELQQLQGRQCMDLYKYSPPGSVAQYNIRNAGPYSTKTSTVCVGTPNKVPTEIRLRDTDLDGSGSDSVRSGL